MHISSRIFTHLATQQSARKTDSKPFHPSHPLTIWSYGSRLGSLPQLILRSFDLYNKASFCRHFILTSLFVSQTSSVWKSQALSLTFWILDSCNVQVSDKKYIIHKQAVSTSHLLSTLLIQYLQKIIIFYNTCNLQL